MPADAGLAETAVFEDATAALTEAAEPDEAAESKKEARTLEPPTDANGAELPDAAVEAPEAPAWNGAKETTTADTALLPDDALDLVEDLLEAAGTTPGAAWTDVPETSLEPAAPIEVSATDLSVAGATGVADAALTSAMDEVMLRAVMTGPEIESIGSAELGRVACHLVKRDNFGHGGL